MFMQTQRQFRKNTIGFVFVLSRDIQYRGACMHVPTAWAKGRFCILVVFSWQSHVQLKVESLRIPRAISVLMVGLGICYCNQSRKAHLAAINYKPMHVKVAQNIVYARM
jgi:hypothetical protein